MSFTVIHKELLRQFSWGFWFIQFCKKFNISFFMRIGIGIITLIVATGNLLNASPAKGQSIDQYNVRLQLNHETLVQGFHKIESQSPFRFMYRYNEVKDIRDLSVNDTWQSVDSLLRHMLAGTHLTYRQAKNQILIMIEKKSGEDLSALNDAANAPPIRGTVVNAKGAPIEGVSIVVKGSDVGTSTDAQGNFTIAVTGNATLVFSSIGFETQEVAITNETAMNVVLQETSRAMNEVVVTALGIRRQSKSLTYATQSLQGDKLSETKDVNMVNALQGKVAGLVITRSANGPGSSSNVLLRGNRSITGNNAPLYVTDGVPGAIGIQDGDNIESVTILKGASAAALYGSAGQNGAILITTKKGVAGKVSVTYNGGLTFDQATVYQKFQTEYGQGDAGIFVPNSEHSYGPKITGQEVTLWNGQTVALQGQPGRIEDFFRTGVTLNNSISLSSGNEKNQLYFSYGNIEAQGIMANNDLGRHIFNFKLSSNISPRLSFDGKATYINQVVKNAPNDYAVTSIFRAPTSIPLSAMQDYEYIGSGETPRQNYWKPGSSIIGNPYYYMNRDLTYNQTNQLAGLFSLRYEISKSLDVTARASIIKAFGRGDNRIYNDAYFSLVGSDYSMFTGNSLQAYFDVLANFRKKLSNNLNFTATVGSSVQGSKSDSTSAEANGLIKDNFFFMTNAKAPVVTNTFGQTPQVQAVYAQATLGYKNYLFLDATARNDWSSALPEGSRSIFYPSVGLTAVVSDMVQLPSWMTYGKARASLANSGYGGAAYLGQAYYSVSTGGGVVTPTIQSFGTYKPELTSSFEAGIDWRFFNNRLGFDVTYYRTRTKNQLLLIGAPAASTFDQRYINAGLIRNTGIEMIINYTAVQAGDFTWTGFLNYAKNENKVIEITPEMNSVIIQDDDVLTAKVETGKAFGTLYVKGWQRDASGNKLVDNNGRPLLTSGKNVYAGNFNPDYTAGLSNTFTYKGISLSVLIDHKNGGTIIGGTQALLDADGHSERSLQGRENGILLDANLADGGKNTQTITSQAYFSAIGDRKPAAEEYAYSATNTRLREMSLGYSIPKQWLSRVSFVQGAKLVLVGRNLFFFKKEAPFDPDIARGRGGEEVTSLPFTRSYGINLKVSF
jgi:TonB-linked SusC/RagA family outer membrane protein